MDPPHQIALGLPAHQALQPVLLLPLRRPQAAALAAALPAQTHPPTAPTPVLSR